MSSPSPISRRRALGLLAASLAGTARAQPIRQFTIATGDLAGTYYPLGGLLAGILTAPWGGGPCRPGDLCGVPGLVAVAQTSEGSSANVEALAEGEVDSALVQADVAHAAYAGRDAFASAPLTGLRALASLYPELVQLVVRRDAEGRPRRLAVGAPRSGTRLAAPRVLPAFGLDPGEVDMADLNPSRALAAIAGNELDGFLTIAGTPTTAVREALARGDMELMPVQLGAARRLVGAGSHWRLEVLPAGLYAEMPATPSLAVPALWVGHARLADELVGALLAALWSPAALEALASGHPAGRHVTLATALEGLSVPLHRAAVEFYRAAGLVASPDDVPHAE